MQQNKKSNQGIIALLLLLPAMFFVFSLLFGSNDKPVETAATSQTSQTVTTQLVASQTTTLQESTGQSSESTVSQSVQSTQKAPVETSGTTTKQPKDETQTQATTTKATTTVAQIKQETTTTQSKRESEPPSNPGLTFVRGILIVNKRHGLPRDYAPGENPTAKSKFMALLADMRKNGFSVSQSYSGFRSYDYQKQLYNSYVNRSGQAAADRFSARPGFSEHQTGLAFDVLNGRGQLLNSSGADRNAAQWLAANAHRYGFIVRYPAGKEYITGYQYEPWHLRYLGDVAKLVYDSQLTLEEFLNVPGGTTYR